VSRRIRTLPAVWVKVRGGGFHAVPRAWHNPSIHVRCSVVYTGRVRWLLPAAFLVLACRSGGGGGNGADAGAVPLVACTATPARIKVGEAAAVHCTAGPGATGPAWSVSPLRGRLEAAGGGDATFVLAVADVDPGFGDTAFAVTALYASAAGTAAGTAQVTVIGNTWLARSDIPAVQAVASDGSQVGAPIPLEGLAGPPTAIAYRSDGAMLVAQAPPPGAAPVLVYSRSGSRLGAFDAVDGAGQALFDLDAPPRDLRQVRDGTVWATGGKRPVLFDAAGHFRARALEAPDRTIGLAQLPDGRVAVTYRWAFAVGLYAETGQALETRALAFVPPQGESYATLGALAATGDGGLLLAAAHLGPTGWAGTLLRLDAALGLDAELAPAARVPKNVPWALSLSGTEIAASPSPVGGETVATCPSRFAADLGARLGCLVEGTRYGGVAHLGPSGAAAGGPSGLARQ
jgi:hypothetical protein